MTDPTPFTLADRLAADTSPLHHDPVADLLLLDDSRWPWLVLVPRVPGARELHDLSPATCARVFERVRLLGQVLQHETGCTSINVGALGNIVTQLHIHVVARHPGDPAWPGPVWGVGTPVRRAPGERPAFTARVVQALAAIDHR